MKESEKVRSEMKSELEWGRGEEKRWKESKGQEKDEIKKNK